MSIKNPLQFMTGFTFRGIRRVQEDCIYSNQDKGIFTICDGFGGPETGNLVSKLTCDAIKNFLEKEAGDIEATLPFVLRSYFSLASNVLFNALLFANQKVWSFNQDREINQKGGASVLSCFIDGDLLSIANVGVCSVWLERNRKLIELVTPRSYGRMLNPTVLDHDIELKVPLMAIGMSEDLEPEIVEYKILPGDWILMQTDGLSALQRSFIFDLKKSPFDNKKVIDDIKERLQSEAFSDNASLLLLGF
ncbi:MAG: SpoIIE family protein phosphatase [Deltaproteobacteria bacterium]|nr:SpoIIE family protein phosphatase [Deltaproteobacteria bacterium]